MLLNRILCSVTSPSVVGKWPIRQLLVFCLAPFSLGCSIHPLPDDVTRSATHAIVQQVRCEAQAAVLEFGGRLGNAGIAYDFEFDIKEHDNGSGDFTLTHPFSSGIFSLTGSAGTDKTRQAVRNFKLSDSFDELRKADCKQATLEKNWIYPLAGSVGIYETVATFTRMQKIEHPGHGEVFTFSDNLTFTTTFDGSVSAKLTLNPVSNRFRVTGANATVGTSRTDIHKVLVTLSAGPETVVTRVSRTGRLIEGRRVARVAGPAGALPGNSLLSTTLVQQGASAKDRALYELDRQRDLEFRRQTTVIVGSP
jgi:hypothetical protein